MNDKVAKIAMAALLHDIGKFWSRTGVSKPYDKKNREHFGDTYLHALWSGTFIEKYINDSDIARWARNHHHAGTVEELMVSLADHLASGERYTDETEEFGRPQNAALVHILTSVSLDEKQPPQRGYLPLVAHDQFLDGAFMPREKVDTVADCYGPLWEGFEKAANDARPAATDITTWLSLLQRFASRIPAATPNRMAGHNVPDISLHEHCRVTAAIASCLAADDLSLEKVREYRSNFDAKNKQNKTVMEETLCHLLCGDLSGVQNFLYDLPRKGAAKTLRSRSFMLQLTASACAEYCCQKAGVPLCNILYNGGGRFYLLIPADVEASSIAAELDDQVQDHFGGALAVIVGAAKVTLNDFLPGKFSEVWEQAGKDCALQKARKYSRRAKSNYKKVFGMMDDFVEVISSAPAEDTGAKTATDETEWGRRLTGARWIVKTETGSREPADKKNINHFFRNLGCEYHLVQKGDTLAKFPQVMEICELNGYSPYDTLNTLRPQGNPSLSYRFIANHWPQNRQGDNLSYEELAATARGAKKIAVFRADVDNLGQVFMHGLGERATAGRVAMLSQAMADFFEGYLNALCREDEYADRMGVIYAGGDDLFLVGAWDAVLDFAVEMQTAFKRYAFHNPAFTLSGGIVLIDDHLPVRHFAEMAGDAEDAAKGYERKHKGETVQKDALTIFEMPFGSEELPRFMELKELLLDVLDTQRTDKAVSAGFLRRLFEVWEAYLQEKQIRTDRNPNIENIQREMHWQRWRWMLVYGLREFTKGAKSHTETIDEIQQRILDAETPIDDRLGMPLRWVELLLKKEERRDTDEAREEYNETETTTERTAL